MFEVKRYFVDGTFYVESESALDVLDLFIEFKGVQSQQIGVILEDESNQYRCELYRWGDVQGDWTQDYKKYSIHDSDGALKTFLNLIQQSL